MKKIRAFVLYSVIIFMMILSLLVLIILENSFINRKVAINEKITYENYIESYGDFIKSLDENKDKWVKAYTNFLDKNNRATIIDHVGNTEIVAFSYFKNCLLINLKTNGINREGYVSYLPDIVYKQNVIELNNRDLPEKFIEKTQSNEKFDLNMKYMDYKEFKDDVYNLKLSGNYLIINDKYRIYNGNRLYMRFINSNVNIDSVNNEEINCFIESDGDINLKSGVSQSGLLLTKGTVFSNEVNLRGKVIAKNIRGTFNEVRTDNQTRNFVYYIQELMDLRVNAFY